MKIIIAGGGISGLTAALSLHAVGLKPVVYEAVGKPAPLGVGINLLPHAMRELTALGLLPELRAAGVDIERLIYLTRYGREIWREPRGLAAGYQWPQIAIHRGKLQMILLEKVRERLGPDAVRFGHALSDLTLGETSATAHFVRREPDASQTLETADVIIAADGIHSAARRKFYPNEGRPKWNGVTLWRSTAKLADFPPGRSMVWAGHSRQKFVAYPIEYDPKTGEVVLNWICDLKGDGEETPPKEDWNSLAQAQELLPAFLEWCWPGVDVPAIVRSAEAIYRFPMVDRDPLERWTFGRVTLLGDAAHPMYPIGSNGATQGVIDARAIAFHLATAPDVPSALQRFEAERREATSRIVMMNRGLGPDKVMDLAQERAPMPTDDLDVLLPMDERADIAAAYKKIAGFDPATLNAQDSYTPTGERRDD